MKIVDANVLLYAINEDSRHHGCAKEWLDEALNGQETIGFPWIVIVGFLRISTSSSASVAPLSVDDAVSQMKTWLSAPCSIAIEPGSAINHLELLHRLLVDAQQGGNLANDAHIAALAKVCHGTVVSFDNDFAKFPSVAWMVPGKKT